MGKRIAITGGAGFIGSHVAYWAQRAGHEVSFFDRRNGHDVLGDLSGLEGADAVIHLAGVLGTMEMFDDIPGAIEQNVLGSYRVAEWCLEHGAQYTGILVPDVFPSIYCATKVAAHRLTSAMRHAKGLKVSHVIAYNAFGPGQAYGPGHPRKFGPTFSMAAWQGRPIPIWGDGTALIDPVPVSIVARMLVDATDHADDAVFDGGLGFAVSVNDVARVVLDVTGSSAGIAYEPMRIGETPTNVAAKGRGWDRLTWHPRTEVAAQYGMVGARPNWKAALAETVNWYEAPALAGAVEVTSGWKPAT
ncbi:MAG TPA: NAD(P)-dependent oxidoreductase [Actinoplanes sp.]|nr:NAD(P)-dependent oxidoreductase [Actinoplanes sp.]